jgi:hypothetical protein
VRRSALGYPVVMKGVAAHLPPRAISSLVKLGLAVPTMSAPPDA